MERKAKKVMSQKLEGLSRAEQKWGLGLKFEDIQGFCSIAECAPKEFRNRQMIT